MVRFALTIYPYSLDAKKMKKTPQNLYDVVKAAVNRHSIKPERWENTTIVCEPGDAAARFASTLVDLGDDEIPIVYCYFSTDEWGIFTTHRVVSSHDGNIGQALYGEIEDYDFGFFKDKRQPTRIVQMMKKDRSQLELAYETSDPSMAPIYALMTMLRLDR